MKPLLLHILRMLGRAWCRLHGAEVHPQALVHGFPKIRIRKGGRLVFEAGATINASGWSNPLNDGRHTIFFADEGAEIRIARGAGVSSSVLVSRIGILVDEGALIGPGSLISDSDGHALPLGSEKPIGMAAIRIGRGAFIGARSTILKGADIGDHEVIGANSVVRKKP